MNTERAKEVRKWKLALGKKEYIQILEGKRVTQHGAIKAMCYACTCGYDNGIELCTSPNCPLYPFQPYNPEKQKREGTQYRGEQFKSKIEAQKRSSESPQEVK